MARSYSDELHIRGRLKALLREHPDAAVFVGVAGFPRFATSEVAFSMVGAGAVHMVAMADALLQRAEEAVAAGIASAPGAEHAAGRLKAEWVAERIAAARAALELMKSDTGPVQ